MFSFCVVFFLRLRQLLPKSNSLRLHFNQHNMATSTSELSPVASSVQESEPSPRSREERPLKKRLRFFRYLLDGIKNFGKELNPTVEFRRRSVPEGSFLTETAVESRRKISQNPAILRRVYEQTLTGRLVPRTTCTTRGHKTYYLLRAFFPVEQKF